MDAAQRRLLLQIAREAVAADLAGEPAPLPGDLPIEVPDFGGAFVSLHNGSALRGCIGTFHPSEPLLQTIRQSAVDAAHDPRFVSRPITLKELPEIDIEISILSPMKRVADPLAIELGVHGIFIRKGYSVGCFLPQVATHYPQWSKEEFLTRCCRDKAGMTPDAWRDPSTEVCTFTAEVFSEHELDKDLCA